MGRPGAGTTPGTFSSRPGPRHSLGLINKCDGPLPRRQVAASWARLLSLYGRTGRSPKPAQAWQLATTTAALPARVAPILL